MKPARRWENSRRVVVVDGVRTPFAKAGTALEEVPAVELARVAIRELLDRTEIDPSDVDEVIFGNAAPPSDAPNIARVAALEAGIPLEVPSFSVARNCASGFQSITDAFNQITLGQADVVIAGGVESMSNVPLQFPDEFSDVMQDLSSARSIGGKVSAAAQLRPSHFKPVVALVQGLTDPVCGLNMGETAEVLAQELGLSRRAQDEYALRSHQRAAAAWAEGLFADEVTPVFVPPRYLDVVAEDVGYRPEQSLEALERLKPVFARRYGTVTAGNSSMITDGAGALLLMEEDRARAAGFRPLGRMDAFAYAGVDPKRMGLGPAASTPIALDRAGLALADVDLIELNEAFAAVVLANMEVFPSRAWAERIGRSEPIGELRQEILNVNGGAIALGHPIAATGTRLALTLLLEMRRRGADRGLATACVGGGQGGSIIFSRIE
ncbi:MAG TPA: thiolase family protein [Gemmatimonadota bacterium]|nr:thiolase family protein [Gemmatimonadota bacterium]